MKCPMEICVGVCRCSLFHSGGDCGGSTLQWHGEWQLKSVMPHEMSTKSLLLHDYSR